MPGLNVKPLSQAVEDKGSQRFKREGMTGLDQ